MSKGRNSFLLLLMVIGLTAASLVAIALRPAVLGLDLQGGVEVVLEGRPTAESPVTEAALERSVEVIRNRVDAFGVAEPEIQTQGTDQIVVALPGLEEPGTVVSDLIKPAQLAFYDQEANQVGEAGFTTNLHEAVTRAQRTRVEDPSRGAETLYAFRAANNRLVAGPVTVAPGTTRAEALEELRGLVRDRDVPWRQIEVESVPRGLTLVTEPLLTTRQGSGAVQYTIYQDRKALTGRDITEASQTREVTSAGAGEPIVTMQFTSAGRDKFREITQNLAIRGQTVGTPQHFAIVLDGQLISAPQIDYTEFPFGIDGSNGATIQGGFTTESAQTLASQLNSGAIPINLVPVSQKQVSATLGAESLRQALIAGIVGLILVLAFLVAYYRLLGVVAAGALMVYAALFYAVVVMWPITLTLPGIAGVILTIGVAADANIVIFERIREESRSGKPPAQALSAGYRKGIAGILDANVVTLATAILVFLFATAGPRGFAFTLGIGVVLSLFTAVVATRAVFGVLLGSRLLRDEKVMALSGGRTFRIDWVGKWKLWAVLSTVPVIFGLVWLGFSGLNLGLDFESGTRISTSFERPVTEDGLRTTFSELGFDQAKIQATTERVRGEDVQGFQIQTQSLSAEQQEDVLRELDARYGIDRDTYSLDQVGPTFGEQIIRNAIQAVILSLIVVALYLIIRFEYKLALPAMLTVVHDVALSIGIYAVTGREVTAATVAALLTILGYSLYDVVIVFDRIRENTPLMRGARYRDVVNRSVNEMFTRSIITSFTTLVPVLALYFFGGPTLHDFSFALLVGILSGGVSSIIIAAPLAAWWKEREPDQKKRRAREERRRLLAEADADIVDVEALARAEEALQAEMTTGSPPVPALEPGGEEPVRRGVVEAVEARDADDEDLDEAVYEPVTPSGGDGAPPEEPEAAPGDGDGTATERPARPRPDPSRPRRHQNVQRRRR
ncbi:MAG TPA: protein translocase subunit SecD [Miltoncostaeaceae bacterium]|nr:protein translocase subunit SecD [Miltoncostaeaceae bacterium]